MKNILTILAVSITIIGCDLENSRSSKSSSELNNELVEYHETSIAPQFSILYQNAAKYISNKEYENAELIYLKLLKTDSNKINALAGLAASQILQNDLLEAKKNYESLIEIDSSNYMGLIGLGSCFYEMKEFEKAIIQYYKATKISPNLEDAYRGLAISYHILNQPDSASFYAKKCIKLSPKSIHRKNLETLIY